MASTTSLAVSAQKRPAVGAFGSWCGAPPTPRETERFWALAGRISPIDVAWALLIVATAPMLVAPAWAEAKAVPAGPRSIETIDHLSYPATFAIEANTLNPAEIAKISWQGWMAKRGINWGSTIGGAPTIRLSFDCRALPWPTIKQHSVDGPDNNMRSLAAHSALHDMFPEEKRLDPIEEGQIAYLLSCSAPQNGLPYTPEWVHRSSGIGHGEFAKNLIQMNQYTGIEWYKTWAKRALDTMRRHAIVEDWPEVGTVAWYPRGMVTPATEPVSEGDDQTMSGWMHLGCGWNAWAFAKWHELAGDEEALEFSLALARRLMNSADEDGNDGSLRPDGSFGGKLESCIASNHMHGHTHCLPGLLLLGKELHKVGRHDEAAQVIDQAQRTFDWLYDPEHNPDAGSWTGWLGEWLMVNTGWERQADCEGCTMGDVVETAVGLAAASRQHESHQEMVDYYDRAEELFRGHCLAQMFTLRPSYCAVLKECLKKAAGRREAGNLRWPDQSARENHARAAKLGAKTASANFPAGEKPAMMFSGAEYFTVTDSEALRLTRFSVYAVVESSGEAGTIFANYNNPINWGKGINLGLNAGGVVSFFTTDGTKENYDPMVSDSAISDGYHLLAYIIDGEHKRVYADGELIGQKSAPPVEYDAATIASIGALREFGNNFQGGVAELMIFDSVSVDQRRKVESYLALKYGLGESADLSAADPGSPVLWVSAEKGLIDPRGERSVEETERELEQTYQSALATAQRMVGQQLGACGFPDWINKLASDLDPDLPGIHMQGCCADATVRAAHAIWRETVTGDADSTRVNMAMNRRCDLVDVVSSLPHRGEVNVIVKKAKKVLVRVPHWAPRESVVLYVNRKPLSPAPWEKSYVVFDSVEPGDQLTVTYPLRIAVIKETPGGLDGTEYTERWRGNTIVDIQPPGKSIPLYLRPELDTEVVPP